MTEHHTAGRESALGANEASGSSTTLASTWVLIYDDCGHEQDFMRSRCNYAERYLEAEVRQHFATCDQCAWAELAVSGTSEIRTDLAVALTDTSGAEGQDVLRQPARVPAARVELGWTWRCATRW